MKRVILFAACGVLGAAAGMGLYGWRQATYLPTEYQLSGAQLQPEALNLEISSPETFSPEPLLSQKLAARAAGGAVTLNEVEVSRLLAQGLAAQANSKEFLQAVQGIDASIEADRVEAGVVMNLADLPRETLPSGVQQAIAQLEQTLPVLTERDVYISIVGRPQVESGRLILDRETAIQIGRLRLPLSDLSEQMGITSEQLESSMASYLEHRGISLEGIDLEDGQMVINFR